MSFVQWWLGGDLGGEGSLVWMGEQWVVMLAAAVSLLIFGLCLIGRRPVLQRALEAGCIAIALLPIVVALARPVWVEEKGRTEPGRIAVLVDASASMSVIEEGTPRSERVSALLESLRGPEVDFYHFGADLAVGLPSSYELPGTDLESALIALSERVGGDRLQAIAVVTDGIDRGLLRRRFQREDEPILPDLPGPLSVYQIGSASKLKDLAVHHVDAGGFAFRSSEFTIRAELRGVGYEGRTVPVALSRDGAKVSTQQVKIGPDGVGEAAFPVIPQSVGRFNYTVSVPDYDDDAVRSNNVFPVVVRVVRDRIRVLQVAGAPSWDVKFLRRFLKGDPSVDLVSFFILRTHEDIHPGEFRSSELSLIEFPYQKLFQTELGRFDLVVFQNFDHLPYFGYASDALLQNLRDYVERDGHGLVMTGGNKSFDLGKYAGTPLEGILPLALGKGGELVDESPFRPSLTEAGERHPVTRLAAESENTVWWERLSEMDGTNLVMGATPEATVLLEHPVLKTASGDPMPVLAVREAGAGRTMALTVDSSWRWSFSEAAEGRGNQAYLRFWKNTFRWLMNDPTTSRISVETPKENYTTGETVRIVVRVRGVDFGPLPAASVTGHVMVGGRKFELPERKTDRDGELIIEFEPTRMGAHRVTLQVEDDGTSVGEGSTVFAITTRDPETDEVIPDEAFLRWLAQRGQGAYHGPGEAVAPVVDPEAGRTVLDRRETSLASAPLLGLLSVLFAGLAWIVRRRSGLR